MLSKIGNSLNNTVKIAPLFAYNYLRFINYIVSGRAVSKIYAVKLFDL